MCGRAYRKTPTADLAKHFEAEPKLDLDASYNIGPTADVAAVRLDKAQAGRELVSLYWGLIPSWAKDDGKRRPMLHNAKAETAHEKPSFRAAFKKRRCLIVFDGFYEWLREDDGTKRGNKRPFLVKLRSDEPIAMAGLWEYNGAFELQSGCVLTTDANELLQQVHTRMPVILTPDAQRAWLDPEVDPIALRELLVPCDPELLDMFEVAKDVNSVRNNAPELLLPLTGGAT
jgi:putative SOS response-associated peptidase YedK